MSELTKFINFHIIPENTKENQADPNLFSLTLKIKLRKRLQWFR